MTDEIWVADSRYAGGTVGASPEPAVGVSVTPGTCQARLRPQDNRLGGGAWFVYTQSRP